MMAVDLASGFLGKSCESSSSAGRPEKTGLYQVDRLPKVQDDVEIRAVQA
jgi:hypothetical protein